MEVGNGKQIEEEYLLEQEHSLISEPDPEPESIDVPKSRIRFSITFNTMLLKSVVTTDAHLSRQGEIKENFTEALKCFIDTAPSAMFIGVSKPTRKSLNGRFKKLILDHRTTVTRNLTASGIIEVRGSKNLYWMI